MGLQLGMGSSQPQPHFDHGDEALFEILKGNIVKWACYPLGRMLALNLSQERKECLRTDENAISPVHHRLEPFPAETIKNAIGTSVGAGV